jgi:hypothetical protein
LARDGKPRLVALAASVLAAAALAAAVAGRSCSVDDDSPEGAVRSFVAAAEAGDEAAIHELLGPATRHKLDQAAERATNLAGNTRRYGPLDLVSIAEVSHRPKKIALVSRDGDIAVVELTGADGATARLSLVREDGDWRIELPDY